MSEAEERDLLRKLRAASPVYIAFLLAQLTRRLGDIAFSDVGRIQERGRQD